MARYFFDIDNGRFRRDNEGVECPDFEAARQQAMASLPEVARFAIPEDGDQQTFTVTVRDESGVAVYAATLTFTAVDLRGSSSGPIAIES